MKPKLISATLLIAAAATCYVPRSTLYREGMWGYGPIEGVRFTEQLAKQELARVAAEITTARSKHHYSVQQRYRVDELLQKLQFGLRQPDSYVVPGTHVVGYADESEIGHPLYWQIWNLQLASKLLADAVGWTPADDAAYEHLKQRPEVSGIWYPQMREKPRSRYLAQLTIERVSLFVCISLALLLVQLGRVGWVVRSMFSRKGLQFFGYGIALVVSVCCSPAVAQSILYKMKKEQPTIGVPVEDGDDQSVPKLDPPTSVNTLKVEPFGDATHDRQQILTFTHRFAPRLSAAFIGQARQAASGKSSLLLLAPGVRFNPLKSLTITTVFGPQYEWKKGRVDQVTAFANASYQGKRWSGLSINRFSFGTEDGVAPAHRHIAAARAGPMPKWLQAWGEFRFTQGRNTENFWGPMVTVGGFLPKRLRGALGGLYLWPHKDFVLGNWDVRVGFTKSFAF